MFTFLCVIIREQQARVFLIFIFGGVFCLKRANWPSAGPTVQEHQSKQVESAPLKMIQQH